MATATKRLDAIDAWLDRVGALEQWQTRIQHSGATLTGYIVNCQLVIVLRYAASDDGWELFIPSSKDGLIASAIDGAATFLGVDGGLGLVGDELTQEKRDRLIRASRSNGPWFKSDNATDVLYDINAFTGENGDKALTLGDVRQFLDGQPDA